MSGGRAVEPQCPGADEASAGGDATAGGARESRQHVVEWQWTGGLACATRRLRIEWPPRHRQPHPRLHLDLAVEHGHGDMVAVHAVHAERRAAIDHAQVRRRDGERGRRLRDTSLQAPLVERAAVARDDAEDAVPVERDVGPTMGPQVRCDERPQRGGGQRSRGGICVVVSLEQRDGRERERPRRIVAVRGARRPGWRRRDDQDERADRERARHGGGHDATCRQPRGVAPRGRFAAAEPRRRREGGERRPELRMHERQSQIRAARRRARREQRFEPAHVVG